MTEDGTGEEDERREWKDERGAARLWIVYNSVDSRVVAPMKRSRPSSHVRAPPARSAAFFLSLSPRRFASSIRLASRAFLRSLCSSTHLSLIHI